MIGRIDVEDGVQQQTTLYSWLSAVSPEGLCLPSQVDTFVHQKGGIAAVIKNDWVGRRPSATLGECTTSIPEGFALQAKIGAPKATLGATPDGAAAA